MVPLGIFTAAAVSRLRFLGVRGAGADIALFGVSLAAVGSAASASVLWVLAHTGVARDAALGPALFYLQFAFGGPGYTVPLGVLLAGLSVPTGFGKLLPRWLVALGLVLAAVGVPSWISLALPGALFLIPLTRFPAFVWLVAAGFALPRTALRPAPSVR